MNDSKLNLSSEIWVASYLAKLSSYIENLIWMTQNWASSHEIATEIEKLITFLQKTIEWL